ncbi:MAG: cytochrome c [Planctomycetota bacterium]|nr:MAG: cytochrome c [Planctomycetota bacterium]REJ96457.1 MAG: cytochrome c [Planctomycetota bacterium]
MRSCNEMLLRVNYLLAALLVVVVALNIVFGRDFSQPHYELFADMKHSVAYDAFSKNSNFASGQTMQSPVPGTIARGEMPLHYQPTPDDARRAGQELTNPIVSGAKGDPLAKSEARGAQVYARFCVACHGGGGAGDGPVALRGFPPPPSLLTGKSLQMKDGQLFHILTYGQGSMAPMAAQLRRPERWDVINYVRSMQSTAPPRAGESKTSADAPAKPDESTKSESES